VALEGLFISMSVAGGLEALGGWVLPVIASAAKPSVSPQDIPARRSQRRSRSPLFLRLTASAGEARGNRRASSGGTVDRFAALAMTVEAVVVLRSLRHHIEFESKRRSASGSRPGHKRAQG
jgi:hypothetical protein